MNFQPEVAAALPEEKTVTSAFKEILDTLWDMLKLLRRFWAIALSVILISTFGALIYSIRSYEPLYSVSSTFSITPLVSADATSGLSVYKFNYTSGFAKQMSVTFPYIASSDNLREAMNYDLGHSMNGHIEVSPIEGTNVFQVTAYSSVAQDAYDNMQSFIRCFPQISEYIFGDTRLNAIFTSELPTEPCNSASHFRHSFYGAAFGLLLVLIGFFWAATERETVHGKQDIATKLNSNCICEIPHATIKRSSDTNKKILRISSRRPAFSESLRVLKKRLLASLPEGDRVIGVTSAVNGEGKTTIAYNLAHLLVNENTRVLLVDTDSTNQELAALQFEGQSGRKTLAEISHNGTRLVAQRLHDNLDVLLAQSASSHAGCSELAKVMAGLRDHYDYIVIDMPACGLSPSAPLIADMCDDVFFVVRDDSASVKTIKAAVQYILYSKARLLGFVVNECGTNGSSYGYSRYQRYGYYGRRYGYYYRRGSKYNHHYLDVGYGIDSRTHSKYYR